VLFVHLNSPQQLRDGTGIPGRWGDGEGSLATSAKENSLRSRNANKMPEAWSAGAMPEECCARGGGSRARGEVLA
jgi:hypothetical protein